ncbi:ribbon-helix-helix domain-containing protein [Anderseniella sp. Alg231-50]|uniref:ribbon-helix-helix domain-containing protein n=1 Tax=Anderseniella sp. Alg231-50 TaxID=1922226 RepID=UPI000D55A7BE
MNAETTIYSVPSGLNMETRVLQHNKSRLAVRLEGVYWQQLEQLAKAGKQSLSAHVHSLLSRVPDKQNRASFLRCHCLQALNSQLQHNVSFPGGSNLGEIITACPSPVFVVSRDRKIVAFNPAFVSSVLEAMKDEDGDQPASPRLTFNQPFKKIVEYLADNPNKVVSGQVGFMTDTATLQRSVRFALLDRSLGARSPVVVFVEAS